jgi:hypothetical protein
MRRPGAQGLTLHCMAAVRDWTYEEVCRVVALSGDVAALGGGVTVALCGHWEHDGPCRWEHFTSSDIVDAAVVVTVHFDAPVNEEQQVRDLVRAALGTGSLVGPDGTTTTWQLAP